MTISGSRRKGKQHLAWPVSYQECSQMTLSHGPPPDHLDTTGITRKPEVGYPSVAIVALFVIKISIPQQFFPG